MLYNMEKLVKKLKKSKSTIKICLDRYNIKRVVKNKVKLYDISIEEMEKIKYFLIYRSDLKYLQDSKKNVQ